MGQGFFDQAYAGRPHWDIGHAQPGLLDAVRRGLVRGPVLDVGCGTGDNTLQLASLGHKSLGIDISAAAIRTAKEKARGRGLPVRFVVGDALAARGFGRRFHTVVDSGFFHGLTDAERSAYAVRAARLLQPGGMLVILCFSDQDAFDVGPRRVSLREIVRTFHGAFDPPDVRPATFEVVPHGGVSRHRAWLASMRRRRVRPLRPVP